MHSKLATLFSFFYKSILKSILRILRSFSIESKFTPGVCFRKPLKADTLFFFIFLLFRSPYVGIPFPKETVIILRAVAIIREEISWGIARRKSRWISEKKALLLFSAVIC